MKLERFLKCNNNYYKLQYTYYAINIKYKYNSELVNNIEFKIFYDLNSNMKHITKFKLNCFEYLKHVLILIYYTKDEIA